MAVSVTLFKFRRNFFEQFPYLEMLRAYAFAHSALYAVTGFAVILDNCISVSGYTVASGNKNMMSSDISGYLYINSRNELRLSKGGGVDEAYIIYEYTKTTD